jgi:hypothetical protein
LIIVGVLAASTLVASRLHAFGAPEADDDERGRDEDEAPETPLDEPRPPRVEDPSAEPARKRAPTWSQRRQQQNGGCNGEYRRA